MSKKKKVKFQNGFNLDVWISRLVEETGPFFYPKKLKCMTVKKKKKKSDN